MYDPDADVVLVAEPDLTLRAGSEAGAGRIWRETKTSKHRLPEDPYSALALYPTFAFDLMLLAALAGQDRDGACELEVLSETESAVFVAPLSDGQLVTVAQQIVATAAAAWSQDLVYERKPSGSCPYCPAHRWCDPPPLEDHGAGDASTEAESYLGVPDPF